MNGVVGVAVDHQGASMVVVRTGPLRVAGVATVRWPARPTPKTAAALLTKARKQLRLPRRHPLAAVALGAPWTIDLLAKAKLIDRASAARRPAAAQITLPLQDHLSVLAVGAALCLLTPAPAAAAPIDTPQWGDGWLVQRIGEPNPMAGAKTR